MGPVIPISLIVLTGSLSNEYKVFLDTLVRRMVSYVRETLIIELIRKYEGVTKTKLSFGRVE